MKSWEAILASVVIAAIRIAGHKTEAFQAFAHMWVGMLIGACALGHWHRVGNYRLYFRLVLILSAVEVVCFLAGLRHH